MISGLRGGAKRSQSGRLRDEAEKPFWISYSDLMTALMVLFMVAMAATLMVITHGINRIEQQKVERDETLQWCMDEIATAMKNSSRPAVSVKAHSIDFGAIAEFGRRGHDLSEERKEAIRELVPGVIRVARSARCQPWVKNIVVDGYASQEGSYLFNLNLSLLRSQRMLCVLLDSSAKNALTEDDRRYIRRKFLVGGASFNAIKNRPEESRRVELRVDFRGFDETMPSEVEIPWDDDIKCPMDRSGSGTL